MNHPIDVAHTAQLRSCELLQEAENERLVSLARASRPGRRERFVMRIGELLMQAGVWLMVRSLARTYLRKRRSRLTTDPAPS